GDWQRALALLQRMRDAGVKPNDAVFGKVIACLGFSGQAPAAVCQWRDMVAEGVAPSPRTLHVTLAAAASGGLWREADEVIAEM
ncbi:unnamed protein product, partial [Phaeothamnion confervicola]